MSGATETLARPSPDPIPDRAEACALAPALTLAERLDAEAAEMGERHLRQLAELAEIGMGLARAVGRRVAEVEAAPDEADRSAELGELGLTLNRVTRAVRLTMTLEARVREARRARLLGIETERAAVVARKAKAEQDYRDMRSGFLGRLVEETVKADICRRNGTAIADYLDGEEDFDEDEGEEIEDAFTTAERLLVRRKAYEGFEHRPYSAVLVELCKDLNIGPPDWSLWAGEEWAEDEVEAAPGSPFAGLSP